jgi:tRNA threonylcarbamoyl adenosine modification protein YeaZ
LSLAVGDDHGVIKEYSGPLEWRHAETLFDGMQGLLKQVHWPVKTLTGVIVSIGPGSFTGIRIGLTAARTFGQALRIPVVGISSLATLAKAALSPDTYVCPTIDALRGDVFTALYTMTPKGEMKTVWKEDRLPLSDLDRKLKPFKRLSLKVISGIYPKASVLMELGRPRLKRASPKSYENVVPLYLRSAAAIERRSK